MPRPRSLSHAQLASAALSVIDRDGLAGLSMRSVAKELGMSTMALYRYVDDREELERLVVDLVLGTVDTEPPGPEAPWQQRIEVLMGRLRDAVAAHPEIVPLTVAHRHRSLAGLRWSESVLGVLTEAGFDGDRRVIALRGLLGYLIGAIQLEHLGPLSGDGTLAIAELPSDAFTLMAETARHARKVSADREFTGGLALLLRGLGA
ncbi:MULTISPECIES: TetR/AcrR family transcriptional regulator [Streptomyces]|uniref:TetR/AcrR family transcriptional regulator n=1 Tax=Streptomyces TaxID=1883 RepID=UPI000CF26F30|nr:MULTISPECIES: TetR/AcrR family transcriptional regulator [Streptomyces]PPS67780.1 TetR family transcriptional regulator [Streptomyces sp. 46]